MTAAAVVIAGCGSGLGDNSLPAEQKPNVFLSVVPPGSNGNSAGGIGTPISEGNIPVTPFPAPPTLTYPDFYRDRDNNGTYDHRAAVVLMDAGTCD